LRVNVDIHFAPNIDILTLMNATLTSRRSIRRTWQRTIKWLLSKRWRRSDTIGSPLILFYCPLPISFRINYILRVITPLICANSVPFQYPLSDVLLQTNAKLSNHPHPRLDVCTASSIYEIRRAVSYSVYIVPSTRSGTVFGRQMLPFPSKPPQCSIILLPSVYVTRWVLYSISDAMISHDIDSKAYHWLHKWWNHSVGEFPYFLFHRAPFQWRFTNNVPMIQSPTSLITPRDLNGDVWCSDSWFVQWWNWGNDHVTWRIFADIFVPIFLMPISYRNIGK